MIGLGARMEGLARDERGATLTEFGFVAPVFVVMLMGVLDAAHTQYTSSVVTGAMQKAGRDMSLENANSNIATLDQRVADIVKQVSPQATVTSSRLSHFDFSDIGKAEAYDDDNNNGVCDNNETFEDMNDNGQWDADRGKAGIGGARDAVVYSATVSYPRLFPMAGLIGLPETVNINSTTVLRNQPYDNQNRTIATGNCT